MTNTITTRRLLMAAAMAGLAVSIYSQASWYGLWLGSTVAGLALALAIDCGIFAAMRAAFDGDDRALWVVGGLAAVSWLANAQHAAMIHAGRALALEGWAALDPLTGVNAVLTAGIAPLAAVALAWLGHRAGKRENVPTPLASTSEPRKAAPAPKAGGKRPAAPHTAPQAGSEPEWYARARALAANGMRPVDIAAEVERSQTRVSRVLNGAAVNGAAGAS